MLLIIFKRIIILQSLNIDIIKNNKIFNKYIQEELKVYLFIIEPLLSIEFIEGVMKNKQFMFNTNKTITIGKDPKSSIPIPDVSLQNL